MSKFSSRSQLIEIMDDLNCSGEVVHQTLRELDSINRWLGGNHVTLDGLEVLLAKQINNNQPLQLADLGCGSGDMLKLISLFFRQKGIPTTLTGIDANPNIIAYAENNCKDYHTVIFKAENITHEIFRSKKFDIVVATLFLHHLSSEELIDTLRSLSSQARIGIVINDLHRHPLAYYSIRFLTLLFSKSAMVKFDAPLSVLRGFKRREWIEILEKAGIKNYSLKWKWAFRWQLIISTQ